jgi:integrase
VPNDSLSYPKVCKRSDGRYYVDLKLNNKRHRLLSGRSIRKSLYPNSYPPNLRRTKAEELAKAVYHYLSNNGYSFNQSFNSVELFDDLIRRKLSEPLLPHYRKTLLKLSAELRNELLSKGELTKGNDIDHIFTNTNRPPNPDYFKTLFRRFKRNSKIDRNITLYSFRHTGAIGIFKRTGSITTLQKAMGHSSLNVSLTYLRGLEVAELKEEDMPMF